MSDFKNLADFFVPEGAQKNAVVFLGFMMEANFEEARKVLPHVSTKSAPGMIISFVQRAKEILEKVSASEEALTKALKEIEDLKASIEQASKILRALQALKIETENNPILTASQGGKELNNALDSYESSIESARAKARDNERSAVPADHSLEVDYLQKVAASMQNLKDLLEKGI